MKDYEVQYARMLRASERIQTAPEYQSDDLDGLKAAFHTHVDAIISFFQHAWHLKDWVKNDAEVPAGTRQAVVTMVEATPDLLLCADIANSTKHLLLTNVRIGGRLGLAEFLRTQTPGRHKIEMFVEIAGGGRQHCRVAAQNAIKAWTAVLKHHGLM